MTQVTDPVRWTADPAEAPEGLRDMFEAGRNEGPSGSQMRALSIKLAAAAAGVGVAATAAKPLAASLGGSTVKTAFAGAKLFAAVTVAGAMTLGGAAVYRIVNSSPTFQSGTEAGAPASPPQERGGLPQVVGAEGAANVNPTIFPLAPPAPVTTGMEPTAQPASATDGMGKHGLAERDGERLQANASRGRDRLRSERSSSVGAEASVGGAMGDGAVKASAEGSRAAGAVASVPSSVEGAKRIGGESVNVGEAPATELGLLRQAQSALNTRPREAFALTQKHRASFPRGQFAEERDALAIQALMRAGERDAAINLAERFVTAYPKSAHAHQFRELLNAH
jgi:hypothetical protein